MNARTGANRGGTVCGISECLTALRSATRERTPRRVRQPRSMRNGAIAAEKFVFNSAPDRATAACPRCACDGRRAATRQQTGSQTPGSVIPGSQTPGFSGSPRRWRSVGTRAPAGAPAATTKRRRAGPGEASAAGHLSTAGEWRGGLAAQCKPTSTHRIFRTRRIVIGR